MNTSGHRRAAWMRRVEMTGRDRPEGMNMHAGIRINAGPGIRGPAGWTFLRLPVLAFLAAFAVHAAPGAVGAEPAPLSRARWIWSETNGPTCELRRVLTLEVAPKSATVLVTADNGYELHVNGAWVGADVGAESEVWQSVERYDLTGRLAKGRNVIGIQGRDLGGVRGVVAALRVEFSDRPAVEWITDESWYASVEGRATDYAHPEFVEGPEWRAARVIGRMGVAPWGVVAWSAAGTMPRKKFVVPALQVASAGPGFAFPEAVAFVGEDCSVYVPLRGDAWGVAFRIGDWSRAYTEFDLPCPSKIGRKLLLWERPAAGAKVSSTRVLVDAGAGVMGSPSASFDGRSLLLAMARAGESFFHVYRVPLDGSEPRRLTDGPFHDIDPVELPDGRILFTSTRAGTFEEYHQPPSRALFRMNGDGTGIHPITSTLIFDNEPKVMADGRVAFIRTDNFFDRGKVETHLHVIRPDGTDGLTEVGANVGADYGVRLRAYGYGSPAPMPDGRLAFISSRGNFIASAGGRERDFQALPGSLGDLAALPDGRLLGTVLRRDGARQVSDVLAVIDPSDNSVTGIHASRDGGIHSPVFVGARVRPPVIPDYVDAARAERPGATGVLFCQDARFTTKRKAGWDRVRAIRVLGARPLTVRSSHSHIVHVGHETVELGTVPLASDGSFLIEVPADTPLALQAVDAEGRSELNEMSWIYVRPGERRSCVGCHAPREGAPLVHTGSAEALRSTPVRLTGQGDPHRYRGNNPGVTGMMDLQFERFREIASLNRHEGRNPAITRGADDIAWLVRWLREEDDDRKISAAQRLAIFRAHEAAPALAACVGSAHREVRLAATLALAACGTRDSVPVLLGALEDADGVVAQAAVLALENLTDHAGPPAASGSREERKRRAAAWREWIAARAWDELERGLLDRLDRSADPRGAIVALGHVGGASARAGLREWIGRAAAQNPYPTFENDNRTDLFTYPANSPLNPRTLQEAVRALGQLRDAESVPWLAGLLREHVRPRTGNLYLAEAVIEALGRVGTTEAEEVLIGAFDGLLDYWEYVGWYSDHPALYACHASPLHGRILEALDALGSVRAGPLAAKMIGSVPTDPDRALFPENDDYETLVGRLLRAGGRGTEVIETCLALLGDAEADAKGEPGLRAALSRTHPAWAGHPGPENRAAQILSLTCRDPRWEPRLRAAFERYVARPEEPVVRRLGNPDWTPIRHWVLFYLARTLGQLGDSGSVEALAGVLGQRWNEARHGRPDPAGPEIHFLHLEYTPCWRAAASWALGRIGDRRASPALFGVVRDLDNAPDVRHAAARALELIADPAAGPALEELAATYPEVRTRRALAAAALAASPGPAGFGTKTSATKPTPRAGGP